MITGRLTIAAALAWSCLTCALPSSRAHADVRDAVNGARLERCPGSAAKKPLQNDSRLANAASRLAAGQSLHGSLAAAGYLATQSSALHLSGAVSDAEVLRALAANDCDTVGDPLLTQMGAQRRGRDVWMVFAAPAALPRTSDAESIARQIGSLVNNARAHGRRCGARTFGAATPLVLNAALTGAAVAHSQDMAAHDEFDHRGHDGSTPAERVTRAAFGAFSVVGENIAAGAMTPADVTAGWLASPPHCENIMDPRFTAMGVGFAVNTSSAELVYWTQDFAAGRR